MRWFETDVSGLPIRPIFNGQAIQEYGFTLQDGTRQVVPQRRFQTTSRGVITQKSEEFSSTAAEVYDLAKVEKTFVLTSEINSKQRTITLIEFVDYKTDMKAGNTGRTSSYTRR